MSERSLSVNPVIEPFAGSVIGLGIGYSMAPRKYSLQRLLILKNDRFEKIYSQDLIKNMSERELQALEVISNARSEYRTVKKNISNDIKISAKKWRNIFKQVDIPQQLADAYATNRRNLQKAIKENDYIGLYQKYRKAKAALKNYPDDENLIKELTNATTKLAKAKSIIASKINLYKNSVTNISNTRLQKVKNEPVKYADVKEAYHNFLKALSKKHTMVANKLFNLTKDKKITESYELLSSYLPKARTRAALWGAAITGVSTTAIMLGLTNNKKRNYA